MFGSNQPKLMLKSGDGMFGSNQPKLMLNSRDEMFGSYPPKLIPQPDHGATGIKFSQPEHSPDG